MPQFLVMYHLEASHRGPGTLTPWCECLTNMLKGKQPLLVIGVNCKSCISLFLKAEVITFSLFSYETFELELFMKFQLIFLISEWSLRLVNAI